MRDLEQDTGATKICSRCGGRAFYWRTAIVPGDPLAPRGSRRGEAHYQPAWQCLNCGYLEPQERRARPAAAADGKTQV